MVVKRLSVLYQISPSFSLGVFCVVFCVGFFLFVFFCFLGGGGLFFVVFSLCPKRSEFVFTDIHLDISLKECITASHRTVYK